MFDGNISKHNKTDYIDRDGSYIILTPDGSFRNFKAEFIELAVKREKFTKFWNCKSLFVVAGTNEFSFLQQMMYLNFSRIIDNIIALF
jgi:hypothetical protein